VAVVASDVEVVRLERDVVGCELPEVCELFGYLGIVGLVGFLQGRCSRSSSWRRNQSGGILEGSECVEL
jgi:hypothetical protein